MHLREVLLKNWRSYQAARFSFPAPTARKRVLLVGAMNGTGKTSLLIGLYLGLFGREAMQYVEGVRLGASAEERFKSYKQLVAHLLHRPALEQDDPKASVELLFDADDREVRIARTWFFTRGGVPRDLDGEGEEVRITVDNRVVKVADWRDANNRIAAELFPPHVMSCYFFDGEQAQARVESSGAAAMSDAIRVLFGTGLLNALDDSLKTYINNERSSLKRDVGEVDAESLDRKRRRRDELEDELSSLKSSISDLRRDLENQTLARKEKVTQLTQLMGDATVDAAQLAQRKAELEQQERNLREELQQALSELALPMALAKQGKRVLQQLDAEVKRDRWLLLRDATEQKVSQILQDAIPPAGDLTVRPPLTESQRDQLTRRLTTTLESLWNPPPSDCASEYRFSFLSSSDRQAVRPRIASVLSSQIANVGGLVNDLETTRAQVRDARRQWDAVADYQPRIEKFKDKVTDLDARIAELGARKATIETRERALGTELNEIRQAIGQMEGQRRKLAPAQAKLDVAERVRSVIGELGDKLIPLCQESLQDNCTRHFREMISQEYKSYSVKFDIDLQPVLVLGTSIVPVSTLSGAQKRAFGLAFTLAVSEISGEDAPLVIDTPVGNADSEYRVRMLTYLARAASGQVIFLSHDEEIYGEYARALEPYLLKKYLVKFEPVGSGAGLSTVVENQYFA
jgi:DNA sulfur modification protein DndD